MKKDGQKDLFFLILNQKKKFVTDVPLGRVNIFGSKVM